MAFVPNVRNLLTGWSINPRTFTAGKYKQTVSLTDNAAPEAIEHFKSQLEAVHRLFLEAVDKYRPKAKREEIETGAHWTAAESMELEIGLVDKIATSQGYLFDRNRKSDLIFLEQKKNFWEDGFGRTMGMLLDSIQARFFSQQSFY